MQKKLLFILLSSVLLAGCQSQKSENKIQLSDSKINIITPTEMPKKTLTENTEATPAAQAKYATLKTSLGDIKIELFGDKTPITVSNFVGLATGQKEWTDPRDGKKKTNTPFYDGIIFHRVIEGFMIQAGDPLGLGYGGPGYKFDDEAFDGEYTRGTVAMANAGPNTNGSQFFIMHRDTPLPKNYVIFGKVVSGIEVVDKIATTETNGSDKPLEDIVIESVTVSQD